MPVDDRRHLAHQPPAALDPVDQVRPVETPHQHPWLPQAKLPNDVLLHPLCGSGCEGMHTKVRKPLPQHPQPSVVGAEVMPPVAHAVRFINREKGDVRFVQSTQHLFRAEAFRSDVQQLELPFVEVAGDLPLLLVGERAVDEGAGNPVRAERVDLILHERDQRRDHHRNSVETDRRRLIAERLAPTGRQHDERILAPQHTLHRRGLQRTKLAIAPTRLQNLL